MALAKLDRALLCVEWIDPSSGLVAIFRPPGLVLPNWPFSPFAQKIGQNNYNSVPWPPIKILRPLFTLQLLILPTRDPFQAQIS